MKAQDAQSLFKSPQNNVLGAISGSASSYVAPALGESEVLYASSGRSGAPYSGEAQKTGTEGARDAEESN